MSYNISLAGVHGMQGPIPSIVLVQRLKTVHHGIHTVLSAVSHVHCKHAVINVIPAYIHVPGTCMCLSHTLNAVLYTWHALTGVYVTNCSGSSSQTFSIYLV